MNKDPKHVPSHEAIAARPKEIGAPEENPEGLDLDHWLRAETELCENYKQERGAEVGKKASAPKAKRTSRSELKAEGSSVGK
jgi:hypothetical protein